MKLSVFLLGLVGTATLSQAASHHPTIPRWVDSAKHGFGYILSKSVSDQTVKYEGYVELTWDFDYNCFKSAWRSYDDWSEFGEISYCNNLYQEYTLKGVKCEEVPEGNVSVEGEVNAWLNTFTANYGDSFNDPLGWDAFNPIYTVIKNPAEKTLIYMRSSDKVVEFVVDQRDHSHDYIYYFPAGFAWDKTVQGVWDFKNKYCPNTASQSFITSNMFSFSKHLSASSANAHPMPESVSAKPTLNTQIGGVRALFSTKNHVVLTKLPVKQSITHDYQEKDEDIWYFVNSVFGNLDTNQDGYITKEEVISHGGQQRDIDDLRIIDTNNDRKVSQQEHFEYLKKHYMGEGLNTIGFMSLAPSKKHENYQSLWTHENSLTRRVDHVFAQTDSDKDGYLSFDEVAVSMQQEGATAQQVTATFEFIDEDNDGFISKQELFNLFAYY